MAMAHEQPALPDEERHQSDTEVTPAPAETEGLASRPSSQPGEVAGTLAMKAKDKSFPTEEIISWILRLGVFARPLLIASGLPMLFATRDTPSPAPFNH